ncbi:MAG: hypothetical protein OQK82_02430 [Candidatus Pacearchaeota archaeon]|nr:hypothetical protein [Candidatus Pacearchaeota archaeon]
MEFKQNKIVRLEDLPKGFSFNLDNEDDLISPNGIFSTVWKVRDENGKVYAGKFQKRAFIRAWNEYLNDSSYLDAVASGRNHENWMAKKIYDINSDYTLKPEGVFAVKLEGEYAVGLEGDVRFPAFVQEYDESFVAKKKLERYNDILQELVKKGFFFNKDALWEGNNLENESGKIKLIDFALWGYNGVISPCPFFYDDSRLPNNPQGWYDFSQSLLIEK